MARALVVAVALATATAAGAAPDREIFDVSPPLDGAIIASGAATSLLLYALDGRIDGRRCPCDRGEVPRFERFAIDHDSDLADRASDVTLLLSLVVPPVADLAAMGGPRRAFLQDATIYAQSLALTGTLTAAVKAATRRPRPLAYAGDPTALRDVQAYRSFFSGHTSLTFAALTTSAWTIRLRHGEQVWPWVVAGVVGASVAAERVLAGSHFPSDVLAGAIAGAAIGSAVPLLHERSGGDGGGGGRTALVPTRYGFAFSGQF